VTKAIPSNGHLQFLSACKPEWSAIAKCTNRAGENWIAARDYVDHPCKGQEGWGCVIPCSMHCYEGKTDYSRDCEQCRGEPVHSVIEKSGSNRWLSWCTKELDFHRFRDNGAQDGEVSHGLRGKPHSHQFRRV